MKVLVAHNRYVSANPSGENVVVDQEIDLLRAAGVEVVPYLRSSDELASATLLTKATLPAAPTYSVSGVRDLRRLVRAERPDVVHLHNPYPLISPWVVRTARSLGVPVVQTVHNYRHVCAKGIYFRDGHDCHDCLGKLVPWPAVAHACYRESRPQSVAMGVALTVHRSTWPRVDRFLALTPMLAEHLRGIGVSADRITVKPNAVPDPGVTEGLGSGFCFVGRLSEEKGVGLLLDAWQAEPAGSLGVLRIAGDGPLRPLVESVAAGRTDVEVLGRVESDEVRRLMRASAVTVVPSTCDEVCPMVAIESLAVGRPVLATAKGGLPYLVPPEVGWTVAPSVAALRDGLRRAAIEAGGKSAAARQRYESTFSPPVVIEQLLSVYHELAAAPSPR